MRISIRWIPVAALLAGLLAGAGCSTVVYDEGYGYPDSDAAIEKDIIGRLRNDDLTGRYVFGVTSQGGIVTLRGSVPNEMVRARAVGIADGADGVIEVRAEQLRSW